MLSSPASSSSSTSSRGSARSLLDALGERARARREALRRGERRLGRADGLGFDRHVDDRRCALRAARLSCERAVRTRGASRGRRARHARRRALHARGAGVEGAAEMIGRCCSRIARARSPSARSPSCMTACARRIRARWSTRCSSTRRAARWTSAAARASPRRCSPRAAATCSAWRSTSAWPQLARSRGIAVEVAPFEQLGRARAHVRPGRVAGRRGTGSIRSPARRRPPRRCARAGGWPVLELRLAAARAGASCSRRSTRAWRRAWRATRCCSAARTRAPKRPSRGSPRASASTRPS